MGFDRRISHLDETVDFETKSVLSPSDEAKRTRDFYFGTKFQSIEGWFFFTKNLMSKLEYTESI